MSSLVPGRKRVVTLLPDAFESLETYAKQHGVTLNQAASCFVRAGVASQEFAERVEELLDQVEDEKIYAN